MRLINRIIFVVFMTAAVLADRPWRNYEVYRPEISHYYVANPAVLNVKYNDHSCIVWFKGNWYCFWTGRSEPQAAPLIYVSESQDARKWSMPVPCFVDGQTCENPCQTPQYRPVAIAWRGRLWVFWSSAAFDSGKINGTYISTLDAPGEKWKNEPLLWDSKPFAKIKDIEYSMEFTGAPITLASGRLVIPAVFSPVSGDAMKIAGTIYTDDLGQSWKPFNEGVDFDSSIERIEAAIWPEPQSENSLAMITAAGIRPEMKKYDSIGAELSNLYWASSRDQGQRWSLPEKLLFDSISSSMAVVVPYPYDGKPLEDDRAIMIYNDSKYENKTLLRNHCSLAMFFNRGGGFDFAAGNEIAPGLNFTANPYIEVRDERLFVSYTQGAQEAAIKVAHISNVPQRDKSYIYPRTAKFKDTQRPVFNPDGYYHFDGGQYITTAEAVNVDENGFSGALWFRGDFEGIIFDSRKDDGSAGFSWFIQSNKINLLLPGVDVFIPEKINQEYIYWTYLGFTVNALHGYIDFYLNGKLIESKEYKKDSLKRLSGDIGYIGLKPGREGLSGDISFLGFYNETFSAAQHRHLYNSFAGQLRLPYVRGESSSPQKPVFELDPVKSNANGELRGFNYPSGNKGGLIELETIAGRNLMRFNGQACAGLDIDTNDRRYGDYLQVEFSFMIDTTEQIVLCTVGDTASAVRIVSRENCLYLSLNGNEQLIGEVQLNRWHTIVIFSGGTITRAKLGNNIFRQISHNPQATWMYLGQAYKTDNVKPDTSFIIDISSVRTRIIRQ